MHDLPNLTVPEAVTDFYIIVSNDPELPTPDVITLRGGAVPTITVDPQDVLVFALPQPLPGAASGKRFLMLDTSCGG